MFEKEAQELAAELFYSPTFIGLRSSATPIIQAALEKVAEEVRKKQLNETADAVIEIGKRCDQQSERIRELELLISKRGTETDGEPLDDSDVIEQFFSYCEHAIGFGLSEPDIQFAKRKYKQQAERIRELGIERDELLEAIKALAELSNTGKVMLPPLFQIQMFRAISVAEGPCSFIRNRINRKYTLDILPDRGIPSPPNKKRPNTGGGASE